MTAISFTGTSIINSFITIYKKQTSRLNKDKLVEVTEFIYKNGIHQDNESSNHTENLEISEEGHIIGKDFDIV